MAQNNATDLERLATVIEESKAESNQKIGHEKKIWEDLTARFGHTSLSEAKKDLTKMKLKRDVLVLKQNEAMGRLKGDFVW